jgi:flagellar basal-body rod modification protein FlgD
MAVNGVSSPPSGTQSGLSGSRAAIADNFDQFLSILTTQLKNQNPLDPLDTNQFTQQLVQFSGVEQQLKTNEFLEALLMLNSSSNGAASEAMSLIGKEITADTNAAELKNGAATWIFTAGGKADNAKITVKDTSGNVVYEGLQNIKAGENRFVWDGKSANGAAQPNGVYSVTIDAVNSSGTPVSTKTQMVGKVEGVDLNGEEPYLIVGAARLSLASIRSVRTAS